MKKHTFKKIALLLIAAGILHHLPAQDTIKAQSFKDVLIESDRVRKYADTSSNSGLRMQMNLIETPQSIQVITHGVIEDQKAQYLNDVTLNMPGVTTNNNFTSFTMRGFSTIEATTTNNFITFDGMLGNMYYFQQQLPLYNIDRVENISGPDAALYSVGTPGGVINMVTKKPLDDPYYSFNVTTGSWNLIDVSADLSGPLTKNKKLLYRLNAGYSNQNSYWKYQYTENFFIAPSLQYNFSKHTSLRVDYVNADNNARETEFYAGALLINPDSTSFNWKKINKSAVFYSPADYNHMRNNTLTLTFDHTFSKFAKITFISRGTLSYLNSGTHTGNYYAGSGSYVDFVTYPDSIQRQYDTWVDHSYQSITSLFATFSFGPKIAHSTILAGIDYQIYGSYDKYIQGTANSVSWTNPNYSHDGFSNYPDSLAFVEDNKEQTQQVAGYLQYLLDINSKFKILLAGRFETFRWISRPNGLDNYTQDNDSSVATAFIPRAGLVYSYTPHGSVYASYCESYNPQYDNSRGNGGPFPPQKGRQVEIGNKMDFLNRRLFASVALYYIDWLNILGQDPTATNPYHEIAIPGLSSWGAELNVMGNIKDFSIIAGYAYNKVVFSSNSPLGNKGQQYDNAPANTANIWLKYELPVKTKARGLSFSVGGKYVDKRIGSTLLSPYYKMPPYFLLNAAINYHIMGFDISLNGYNLLNSTYVTGWYASDFMTQLGNPINWKLSLRYTVDTKKIKRKHS